MTCASYTVQPLYCNSHDAEWYMWLNGVWGIHGGGIASTHVILACTHVLGSHKDFFQDIEACR